MSTVTIATINIHRTLDRWRQRRPLLVEQLIDLSPDVLALQEVALPIRQAHWLRSQLNARMAEKSAPYQLVQARRRGGSAAFYEGIAILSRLPILSHDVLGLSFGRIALRANIELHNGTTIDVITTHLHSHPHTPQTRDEQVMRIVGWLDDSGSVVPQRVLLGTFRDLPDSMAVVRMKSFFSFRSALEAANGREPVSTWPTALNTSNRRSGVCHDYIFLSPQMGTVAEAGLCLTKPSDEDITLLPSDHVGLYAKIAVV